MLEALSKLFGDGGIGINDAARKILQELQGLAINPVTGAAANSKMDVAALRSEDTLLSALFQNPTTVLGVAEVQTITVDATGGTFTVTWNGQTTTALAFDISAAAFTTALAALSNVQAGDVTVTGGPGDDGGNTPYTLTWDARLGNVAQPTTNATGLTGGGGTATPATSTAGVQQLGAGWADIKSTLTIEATQASGTITISGNPVADETFVVNGVTYTFKATPTDMRHVKITTGNNTAMGLAAAAAINAYENRRTGGGFNAPAVVAVAVAGVVTVTAVVDGTGGNSITLTEAATNVAVSGAGALAGGTNTGGVKSTLDLNGESFILVWFNKK